MEEEEETEEEEEEEEDGSIRSSISIYVVLLSYNDFTQHNTVRCTHRVRDACTQRIHQNTAPIPIGIRKNTALPPRHPCVGYWETLGSRHYYYAPSPHLVRFDGPHQRRLHTPRHRIHLRGARLQDRHAGLGVARR